MRVTLLVDAAYAFDYLSILQIKFRKSKSHECIANFIECRNRLIEQVGKPLFDKVFRSKEYNDLLITNDKIFKLVDLSKNDECLASEVDRVNYERHIYKMKLQKKFFNNDLTEIKIKNNT